jgi:hypothetical protein
MELNVNVSYCNKQPKNIIGITQLPFAVLVDIIYVFVYVHHVCLFSSFVCENFQNESSSPSFHCSILHYIGVLSLFLD